MSHAASKTWGHRVLSGTQRRRVRTAGSSHRECAQNQPQSRTETPRLRSELPTPRPSSGSRQSSRARAGDGERTGPPRAAAGHTNVCICQNSERHTEEVMFTGCDLCLNDVD